MLADITDADIALRAAQGDEAAFAEYFRRNRPLLLGMAARIGGEAIDPQDLLSDTLLSLLELWHSGRGPSENLNSYLIQSMRNRVRDHFRSPRSRVSALPEHEPPELIAEPDLHASEIFQERAVVRRALHKLGVDQRAVLNATIIDGSPPSDVAVQLQRSAGAVYTLQHRAKQSLKRAILHELITERCGSDCLHATQDLPKALPDSLDEATDPALTHIRTCPRCGAQWKRYLSLATLALAAPVLFFSTDSAPAEANELLSADTPNSATAATGSAQVGGLIATILGTTAGKLTLGGIALVVVGAAATTAGIVHLAQRQDTPAETLDADLTVSSREAGEDRSLDMRLDLKGTITEDLSLTVEFPNDAHIVSEPEAWECQHASGLLTCTVAPELDDRLLLQIPSGSEDGAIIHVAVQAVVGSRTLTGEASIPLSEPESHVFATLD